MKDKVLIGNINWCRNNLLSDGRISITSYFKEIEEELEKNGTSINQILQEEMKDDVRRKKLVTNFKKIISDNSIEDFPYKDVIDKMINRNPSYRYESFKQIKDDIVYEIKKDDISMLNIKDNYQELTNLLDNIISSKDEKSETFSLNAIIDNLEKLYNNNVLNDVLDNNVFFADCFISKVMEYYPKKKTITIQYIHGLFNWLKQLTEEEKKQVEKCLTFKLNNYPTYVEDLPF